MGLMAWYPLNGDLKDYSGNGYHCTSGWTENLNGKIGKCYEKNGTINMPFSCNKIGPIMSLCFWIWTDSSSTGTGILCGTDGPRSHTTFFQYPTRNDLHWSSAEEGATDTTNVNSGIDTGVILDNEWTHVVLIYDGNRLERYYNGVLKGTYVNKIPRWSETRKFSFTALNSTKLNDIRIYNHHLSIKEIKEISKAKILHYNFNHSSDRVYDLSGFENHSKPLNYTSVPKWSENGYLGNGCYQFDNADKPSGTYQHIQSNTDLRVPESGTISFYIKHSGAVNSGNKYAVGFQYFCSMNNEGIIGFIYYTGGTEKTVSTSCQFYDNKWHMYTITWISNPGIINLYQDGVLQHTGSSGYLSYVGLYHPFLIGSAWGTGYGGISGYIDDVRLYATTLSDADVLELYETRLSVSKIGQLFSSELVEDTFATNNDFNKKGQCIAAEINETSRKIRYVRDYLNGSSANTANHWCELKVMSDTTNLARGIIATGSISVSNAAVMTDNVVDSNYASAGTGLQYIQLDLGGIKDADYIHVWHYYPDGRTYYNTKTQVSVDGTNWITIYDSAIEGTYVETSLGKIIPLDKVDQPFQNCKNGLARASEFIEN